MSICRLKSLYAFSKNFFVDAYSWKRLPLCLNMFRYGILNFFFKESGFDRERNPS